jgi:hypothetical protein
MCWRLKTRYFEPFSSRGTLKGLEHNYLPIPSHLLSCLTPLLWVSLVRVVLWLNNKIVFKRQIFSITFPYTWNTLHFYLHVFSNNLCIPCASMNWTYLQPLFSSLLHNYLISSKHLDMLDYIYIYIYIRFKIQRKIC